MPKTIEERVALLENYAQTQYEQTKLLQQITEKHQQALLDISRILDAMRQHMDLSTEFMRETFNEGK